MKERPILFSSPMVRAILEGRKTMTRLVIKSHPFIGCGFTDEYVKMPENHLVDDCPYGIGDRLWVRETWNGTQGEGISYRATDPTMDGEPWRPSIHMPRWASRITLEITGIRVERLQDISEEDARAEGVGAHGGWNADETEYGVNARGPFSHLWDSINAKRHPWASNPWVWVIEFRRAE